MHHGIIRAEAITVDSDETGFYLIVASSDEDDITVRLDGLEEQLYDQVRGRIGPWLYERDEAQHRARVFAHCDIDESGGQELAFRESFGYALNDPKHPTYHERMSDATNPDEYAYLREETKRERVDLYDQERDR